MVGIDLFNPLFGGGSVLVEGRGMGARRFLKTPFYTFIYKTRDETRHILTTTKTAVPYYRFDVLVNMLLFVFMNYMVLES